MDEIRFFNRETVERTLTMERCIEAVKNAMIAVSNGKFSAPPRLIAPLYDNSGLFGLMPGSTGDPAVFGAKVLSVLPDNPVKGRPTIQGFVCLFDHETGAPIAIVEGGSITAIRTSAASGLATALLAREDVKTHGIFGTGIQASVHADAIRLARPSIDKTYIWGRNFEKARAAADQVAEKLDIAVEAIADAEAAAACDVVSTVTGAAQPILKGEWLRPGAHVNLVGSHSKNSREADTAVITRSKVYIDLLESVRNEAGDILIPIEEGAFSLDKIIGEIGALAQGLIEGRESAEEITCYKSLGVVAQDIFAAQTILENT